MKTKTIQINIFEKRAFTALIAIVFILLSFYGYFISKSIFNVIVREEINNDVIAVSSAISELEFEYISHKNAINKEYAISAGFTKLASKKFITRKSFAKLSFEN
jgi:hypothetical protein